MSSFTVPAGHDELYPFATLNDARFVPIVRTFAPFVAGAGKMAYPRFLSFSVLGTLLWVGGLVSAGYFLGNLEWARQNFSLIVYGIIIISVLPVVIEVVRGRMGKHKDAHKG